MQSRKRQPYSITKDLHSQGWAHDPRGANSSKAPALQLEKIAGTPNQANGFMVGSFMRAPQEKPSIGSTI